MAESVEAEQAADQEEVVEHRHYADASGPKHECIVKTQ